MFMLIEWLKAHGWEYDPIDKGRGIHLIYRNGEENIRTEEEAEKFYKEVRLNDREYHEFQSMTKKVLGSYQRDFETEDEWNISPLYQIKWSDQRTKESHGLLGLSKVNVLAIMDKLSCFVSDDLTPDNLQETKTKLLRKIETSIEEAFALFNQREYRVSLEDIKTVKYLKSQLEGLGYVVR